MTQIDSNQLRSYSLHKPRQTCAKVVLGHLWYNLGTVMGPSSAAPSGILPVCQEVQARPALGLMPLAPHTSLLPPVCALSLTGSRLELSYSALRLEQIIRLAKC